MKDYEYPPLALPVSENLGDPYLPAGCSDNDPYFTEGDETFGDGVPREVNRESVRRDPAEVDALCQEIESTIPDDVLGLFGGRMTTYLNTRADEMRARVGRDCCAWCGAEDYSRGCYCRHCDSCGRYWLDARPREHSDGRPLMKVCPDCQESEAA